jgi:hypothetical protein
MAMPIHDWTRAPVGVFHNFHLAWPVDLQRCLNQRILPQTHYAMIEFADPEKAPRVWEQATEWQALSCLRRHLAIRRTSSDHTTASIELVSPAPFDAATSTRFAKKLLTELERCRSLLVVDLFPAPAAGIDFLSLLNGLLDGSNAARVPQTAGVASYAAYPEMHEIVQNVAVGSDIAPMPLFLERDLSVETPLQGTYASAYAGMPERWRRVIEQ